MFFRGGSVPSAVSFRVEAFGFDARVVNLAAKTSGCVRLLWTLGRRFTASRRLRFLVDNYRRLLGGLLVGHNQDPLSSNFGSQWLNDITLKERLLRRAAATLFDAFWSTRDPPRR